MNPVSKRPPIRGEDCLPLWYVSDLGRIRFSARELDGRTAVNSMGNRRCAVPDLYPIFRFRLDW